jgi:hypothetical protein
MHALQLTEYTVDRAIHATVPITSEGVIRFADVKPIEIHHHFGSLLSYINNIPCYRYNVKKIGKLFLVA